MSKPWRLVPIEIAPLIGTDEGIGTMTLERWQCSNSNSSRVGN